MAKGKNPIHLNPAHKGKLHRALGIPEDKPIPAKRLEEASHSENPDVRKMVGFAKAAKHWSHH